MLRIGPPLLIQLIGILLFCGSLLMEGASAQVEDLYAPWRLESTGQIDPQTAEAVELNNARLEDLLQIPLMPAALANSILHFRQTGGRYTSLEEFQRLHNVDPELLNLLLPYIDVYPDSSAVSLRFLSRYQQDFPPSQDVSSSPYRAGSKFMLRSSKNLALGIAVEKDAGEIQLWDQTAVTFMAPLPGHLGRLVMGDYLVGYGEGLVIRTARNFGLGRDAEHNLYKNTPGLRPYAGWEENLALRGAGATINRSPLDFTVWASQRSRDAYLDSTGNISSFNESGLQRTAGELAGRDACREELLGLHVERILFSSALEIGLTAYAIKWNKPVQQDDSFTDGAQAGGLEIAYAKKEYQGRCEIALDQQGRSAVMAVLQGSFGQLHSTLSGYWIAPHYYSPLASSLDFAPGEVQNRLGVYSGLGIYPDWGSISGFIHLYQYPLRRPGESWGGQDICLNAERQFTHQLQLELSSRWVQEVENDSSQNAGRWRGSGFLQLKPEENWVLRSELQICRTHGFSGLGQMLQLGILRPFPWGSFTGIEVAVLTGIYNTPAYENRVYWSETDMGGGVTIHPLWGAGSALQLNIIGWHEVWGRLACSGYWDQPEREVGARAPEHSLVITYRYP